MLRFKCNYILSYSIGCVRVRWSKIRLTWVSGLSYEVSERCSERRSPNVATSSAKFNEKHGKESKDLNFFLSLMLIIRMTISHRWWWLWPTWLFTHILKITTQPHRNQHHTVRSSWKPNFELFADDLHNDYWFRDCFQAEPKQKHNVFLVRITYKKW